MTEVQGSPEDWPVDESTDEPIQDAPHISEAVGHTDDSPPPADPNAQGRTSSQTTADGQSKSG